MNSRHCRSWRAAAFIAVAATWLFSAQAWARVLELVDQTVDANLLTVSSLALSPDGRSLYISGFQTLQFDRDESTGVLTFVDAGEGADWISVSPDGKSVYLGKRFRSLRAHRRDATGALTFVESWDEDMSGLEGLSMTSVEVSADGRHVYVTTSDSSLVVFSRDAATGVLTWVETHIEGVAGVAGLLGPQHSAISPDGSHVYVVGQSVDMAVFERDASSGRLTFLQSISGNVGDVNVLAGSDYVLVSHDGEDVYVAGSAGVAGWSRNPADGSLQFVALAGMSASALTMTSDRRLIYAVGDDQIQVLLRTEGSGALRHVDSFHVGRFNFKNLSAVALSPDEQFLYVVSPRHDFTRDRSGVLAISRPDYPASMRLVAAYVDDVEGDAEGIRNASSSVVSPDGRHVYVAGANVAGSLAALSRSASTGRLEFIASYGESNGVFGLDNAESVAISPDGRSLYVACRLFGNSVVVFERDSETGELTHLETRLAEVSDAEAVVVSPDGRHVIVASRGNDSLVVFTRDLATGRLELLESYPDGLFGVEGLDGVHAVTVSPDGAHVYAAGYASLAVFERDSETGELTFLEVFFADVDGIPGLIGTPSIAVSRDGRNVYVGSEFATLSVLARDPSTGRLRHLEDHRSAGDPIESIDGRYVFGFAEAANVFRRDSATGRLRLVESVDLEYFARTAAASPDGRHVYVGASRTLLDKVLVFRTEEGPCRVGYDGVCLGGDRFQVELDWRDERGNTGTAEVVHNGSDDSGVFYFFDQDNWELLLKVLDGCEVNDRFWVFAAATTDVEYTLRVTDAATGLTNRYFNPLGTAAVAITDTDAFATCNGESAMPSRTVAEAVTVPRIPVTVTDSQTSLDKATGLGTVVGFGGKCLDVEGGATADGTPVNIYTCDKAKANQRWHFDDRCAYSCPGDFELNVFGDKCLQPESDSGTPRLVIGPCGVSESRWLVEGAYPANFTLFHRDSELCADVEGNSSEDGTPVNLFECHGDANQQWRYDKNRCKAGPVNLCKSQMRFRVEVEWRDFEGKSGKGRVLPQGSDDSGLFWFFGPENWEMLVKVLDGCEINDRHWVFAAATTNVEYTLRVTDTETGRVREYFNPLGNSAASITDTEAFASCSQ